MATRRVIVSTVTPSGGRSRAQHEVLGVTIDLIETDVLVDAVATAVARKQRMVVGNHNLHSVYLMRTTPSLACFYEAADMVFADGMSLVLASRLAGRPIPSACRSTLLDWFETLLDRLGDGTRVFFLGSRPGAVDLTVDHFRQRFPRLCLAGRHGYFGVDPAGAEPLSVVAEIADFGPDLLLVGMGMPRQELWVVDNLPSLRVPVVLTVGGLFDYYNGSARTPPRWMGRLGLEWLYRLADDPQRLAHRYLVEPFLLARLLFRERRRR